MDFKGVDYVGANQIELTPWIETEGENGRGGMIQPNELRRGNYVNDRAGKLLRIDWMERHKVCQKMEINGQEVHPLTEDFEHLQPIPLTEKWLLRFGFGERNGVFTKSRQQELGHDLGDFSVSFYDDTQMKVWRGDRYIGVVGSCGFVHQFQNLYFILNAQELTIKQLK